MRQTRSRRRWLVWIGAVLVASIVGWIGMLAFPQPSCRHQVVVDRIGRRALPQWKREGLAEYVANIGLIRSDDTADLVSRLKVFDDDRAWSSTQGSARRGWDRIHYEAGLLVEFLIDVRGLTFAEVAADGVTRESTRAALRAWAQPR